MTDPAGRTLNGEQSRATIVLELPEPVAGQIGRVQRRFGYAQDSQLPVHVTLAGSNGLGEVQLEDESVAALSVLDVIGKATAPITASFGGAIRFPGTDTFALTLVDDGRTIALHRMIAESGLSFGAMPFPFTPHCTLTSGMPRTTEETEELLATLVPGTFVLDSLSAYSVRPPRHLLHRATLAAGG